MVVGDAHQSFSTSSANDSRSSSSHASSTQHGAHHSASVTPRHATSTGATPHSSQPPPASTPIAVPQSRSNSHNYSHDTSNAGDAIPPHQGRINPSQGAGHHNPRYGRDQDGPPGAATASGYVSSPPSPRLQPTYRSSLSLASGFPSPNRIKVRDLDHIQSFASEEVLTRSHHGSRRSLRSRQDGGQQYEISSMPVTDIIEMVAGLLTKITTTNDRQHEHLHRHIPPPEGATGLSPQTTSVLAFHGKNVPSITILSYLSRIHKYCPTTYEVFLSLLVYFDRMTEMVNNGTLQTFREAADPAGTHENHQISQPINIAGPSTAQPASRMIATPPSTGSFGTQDRPGQATSSSTPPVLSPDIDAYNLSHFFVVDSFNIHRLVIAGVTCASKFFSDVFYTNSRYAKVYPPTFDPPPSQLPLLIQSIIQVGGLPLVELNHLELQFLLLNDFRLSIPVEELEAYGTMLVEFYAREVLAQQQGNHSADDLYMQQGPTPP
ncbi:MAG: hypothetical protein LQ347_002231 [Umbilicaria vellea]|nr:MAG: hypothetical protein LQ347_002231 [Umbilicaria vellea]